MATKTQLQLVITAKNEASAKIKKLSGDVSSFQKKFDRSMSLVASATKVVGVAMLAVGASAVVMGKKAIDASIQMENAMLGLATVSKAFGESQDEAKQAAVNLAKDGLLTVSEAAEGLKNLIPRLGLERSIELMNGFKDSAAFNRQGTLGFGQAIVGAAQGIKNMNSIMVDNAGITKNLSIIMSQAGFTMQDLDDDTKGVAASNALYTGLLKETAIFQGDAEKSAGTLGGKMSQLNVAIFNLKVQIGDALKPAVIEIVQELQKWVEKMTASGGIDEAVKKFTASVMEGITWLRENKETVISLMNTFITFGKIVIKVAVAVALAMVDFQEKLETSFYIVFVAVDNARKGFEKFKNAVKEVTSNAMESVGKMSSFMTDKIDAVVKALAKMKEKLKSLGSKVFELPGKQFGGAVTAGSPTLVGEHRPEVFVPSQSGNIKQVDQAGAGAVNINFNNVSVRNDNDLEMVINAVKESLRRDTNLSRSGINI